MSSGGRSYVWWVRIVLVGVVLLTVCGRPPTPAPQWKLRISLMPSVGYLPYFVMRAQGFDRKNGLQFEERLYPGGVAMVEAMVANALDVSYVASVPLLSAAERGLIPGTVVPVAANGFADPEHPFIGVLAGRSIQRWKDLEGKQIAVNETYSLNTAALAGRLRLEGVRNYSFVNIPTANKGLAVAEGNVPAAVIVEPFLSQSLLRGDGKLLGWIIGGPPFERMEPILVAFRAGFYRDHPQAVKAFLRAQLQAVRWIHQNPKKARSILGQRLRLSPEVVQKAFLLRWTPDTRSDPALLEGMQPLLIQLGMLKAPIPASRLYDETLLNQVLAERR